MEVHTELGPGFLESVYEEAFTMEAGRRKIPYRTQVKIPVKYKGQQLNKEFIADFIGYERVLVELKCIPKLTKRESAQIINYLKATSLLVGLLINFGSYPKLEWNRFVYSKGNGDWNNTNE